MKLVCEITFLYDIDNCFLHFNEKNLNFIQENSALNNCYEIHVLGVSTTVFCSFSRLPKSGLNDNQIGINSDFARLIGLEEGQIVVVSRISTSPLTSVTVSPKNLHDFDLIVKYYTELEKSVLNQINVVARDQLINIKLFGNVIINLKVESLNPDSPFGLLQEKTDLKILPPFEMDKRHIKAPKGFGGTIKDVVISILKQIVQFIHKCQEFLKFYFVSKKNSTDIEKESEEVDINNLIKYKIGTNLIVKNNYPVHIMDRFIFVANFPSVNVYTDPVSFKIISRIRKADGSLNETYNDRNILTYMITSNEKNENLNRVAYCSDSIMRNLNLKVGSYVTIEKTDEKNLMNHMDSWEFYNKSENSDFQKIAEDLFEHSVKMRDMYENVVRTVLDNVKHNQRLNTLIIGDVGTGKTFLLDSLVDGFTKNFFHCVKITCKTLRMLKINTLRQSIQTKLDECCEFQPSIFFIDDLDALMIQSDEENHHGLMYSQRVGDLLIDLLGTCQRNYDIYFIATVSSMLNLGSMSTERGPLLFQIIHKIDILELDEREAILRKFIDERYLNGQSSFIRDIAYETKGYNIQDLSDLIEMASFNYHMRNESSTDLCINKSDFEKALTEKIPLSLYGVNLTKNEDIKWELVGGMEEPKKLLKEIFDWPLRYKEIYKSSPLRLQCGVLLYGIPGTGKTLLASAVANECELNFISVKGPEIFSKYVGASEEGIRDLFIRARKAKPCLLFFDEFDSLAPRRGTSNVDVNDRVVNQILTELDGVEELTEVFILAATSRPDLLDPALLRPGRIDRAVHCALPNKGERLSILKALAKDLKFSDDVDLEKISEMTEDYTGADLRAVLYAAQTAMIKELHEDSIDGTSQEFVIENKHLLSGLDHTQPSVSTKDKEMYQSIYDRFLESRLRGAMQKLKETGPKIMFA